MFRRFTGWFHRSISEHKVAFRVFLILTVMAFVFLSIVFYIVAVDNNPKIQNKRHLAAIEDARVELPEEAKTPLGSAFLDEEYKVFRLPDNRLVFLAYLGLLFIAAALTVLSFMANIVGIRLLKKKDRNRFLNRYYIRSFMLPPLSLFFLGLTIYLMIDPCKKVGFVKRTYEVRELNVVMKNSESKQFTEPDGRKSTYGSYYLQCERNGEQYIEKVNFEIYNQVQEHGTYYLVYVHYDDLSDFVGIYSAEEYEYPVRQR